MRVDDFDFLLPEERIALYPARPRDASRLLHVTQGGVEDRMTIDLSTLLRRGDMLVLNDTKVIPAQLAGIRCSRKEVGDNVDVDITLHKRIGHNDFESWLAFARPAKRLRKDDHLIFGTGHLRATVISRDGPEVELKFNKFGEGFYLALSREGYPPLPPYIARRRAHSEEDVSDYQTIYAQEAGSVAAPTAGLHFTEGLFVALADAGVARQTITLHVGAGTFLPMSVDDTSDHKMHAEYGQITPEQADAINATRARGGRIVAVGTTSLRLLESAADDDGVIYPIATDTDIFITPGYQFKAVDLLMTNFHLPRSTLFMLVCAFAGLKNMKAAYAHAIENDYRFYSYGDACLLERQ